MSTLPQLNTYLQRKLHEGLSLYAIVDAGIHDAFSTDLYSYDEANYRILLKEPLAQEVEEAAPYLLRLNLEEESTQALMKEGFATHWLTYIISHKDLDSLCYELRDMVMPYSEVQQREILFRFYDPRNLDNYLLMHDDDERIEMFADIGGALFCVDVDEPQFLHVYSADANFEITDLEVTDDETY